MYGGGYLYLKRLEIQGFKSFADKVELEFNSGITVVVGPNGSGKSNVVDAIRWVLGEQSAKTLRGMRMDDIIFSGSSNRRPVGMAQVSLTLDNSSGIFPLDYNEVTVSRRLYRSGESEYLINKVPCRMKDIHQLFMDTGVGKEGFSVIGQGKIDEVLSLKAEDRRNLIEEAAGIVKYRYRKREAERKLEDTEQSLLRINDIVGELTEQLGPLKEQADKAKQYQNWKKELDQWEISLAVHAIEENQTKEQELNKLLEELEDRLTQANTQYHQLSSQIENYRFENQQLDQYISDLQKNYYDVNTQLERQEHQIEMFKERKKGIIAQINRINLDLKGLQNEKKNLNINIQNKQQELEQLVGEYNEAVNIVQELTETIDKYKNNLIDNNSLLEDYKSQVIETLQEKANINNEITRLVNEINISQRRYQQLDEKIKNIKINLQEAERQLSLIENEKLKLLNNKKKTEEELQKVQDFLAKSSQEYNKLKKDIDTKQINYQQIKSRLQMLEEMEETGEGYQQGVKMILEMVRNNSKALTGVLGTVADVISVPQNLEIAIETALGGALQYLITDNDEAAQKAIDFLKAEKKGRATFLPLNTIKANRSNMQLNDTQVIGRAVELVNFEPRYLEVMEYLLGRIWVVKDLATAVKLGKKTKFSVRMVTLEGELITPGGALTGGSYSKQKTGILTRKRLLKELSQKLVKLEEEISIFKQKLVINELKQQELTEKIDNCKDLLQTQILHMAEMDNKKEQVLRDIQRISTEKEINLLEQGEIENQIKSYEKEKERFSRELNKLQIKNQDIEQQITDLQEHLKEIAAAQENLTEDLNDKKIAVATLKQAKDMKKELLAQLEQRLNTSKKEEIKLLDEISQLETRLQELEENIKEAEDKIKEFTGNLEKLQRNIEEQKEKRAGLVQVHSSLEKEIKSQQLIIEQLKNDIYQNNMKVTRVQMEINSSQEKLREQFGCDFQEALELRLEIESKKNVTRRISELKDFISQLGLVNFAAINEYERVKQRLEFLSKQLADLEEAKTSLLKVIKDMDQIMMKKFKETFSQVNEAFNLVFKEMFGGGSASLKLSDADNLLETGIEIIAQPPGKKPQTLSLLSGGERAMTAIALLFAILKVKPSPFCVLDEIEAALDEANVDKFANFLKSFVEKTQFIIISHRKGTMEAADVLYGVTIEEHTGVSKLISVKLSEAV